MPSLLLVGLQWGDEGKGKVVDAFAGVADVVMRYQGGANSGHTLQHKGETVVLHHLPSGIFHSHTVNVLGWGMVISPDVLLEEIQTVERIRGSKITPGQLAISAHTSLVLPAHRRLEARREAQKKIGTTQRGIGPTYEDRIGRNALRIADILSKNESQLKECIEVMYTGHGHVSSSFEAELKEEIKATAVLCKKFLQTIEKYVAPVSRLVRKAYDDHKKILFEGAQGAMLDIQQGTYPYVTSSMTGHSGVHASLGVYTPIDRRMGVAKAYCTRVGEGPFPGELKGELADTLQSDGNEVGATTGRKRRVGWMDLVQLRYALQANGVTDIILTKADILNGYGKIGVVTSYKRHGKEVQWLEGGYEITADVEPVVEQIPCWKEVVVRGKVSPELEAYCQRIESFTGAHVSAVSYGPQREEVIFRGNKSFSDFYQ